MLPTPDTSHLDFRNVYEPAEDSFLLLDTLSSESESTFLQSRLSPRSPSPLVLEIGPGSGVVLAFVTANAQSILGRTDVTTLGVDVNGWACKATAATVGRAIAASRAQGRPCADFLGVVEGDLASPLLPNTVDVLIFNPPYVPTEDVPSQVIIEEDNSSTTNPNAQYELDAKLLQLSWSGGADGMEVTDRLLAGLPSVLSERGLAYVLLCSQNKPNDVLNRIKGEFPAKDGGRRWECTVAGSSGKTAGREKLVVIRIWRP